MNGLDIKTDGVLGGAMDSAWVTERRPWAETSIQGNIVTAFQRKTTRSGAVLPVLCAASFCHLLNDMLQALLPAIYPIIRGNFDLTFAQLGILTFVYQLTGSILQPFIGQFTDQRPLPYFLPFGMMVSTGGLLTIAYAPNYEALLAGGMMLGIGSAIFHPETSRIARLASGGSHGLAQSLFQVGGNLGSAIAPLAAALIILPTGQGGVAWFSMAAVFGIVILTGLSNWYRRAGRATVPAVRITAKLPSLSSRQIAWSLTILLALLFSKYVYMASFTSYYALYLIDHFGVSTKTAQLLQFVFLAAIAIGTIVGGPIGDRMGSKPVIWVSILGVLPFTLLLPHVGLSATVLLTVIIGLVMSSAFPAIVVFGHELIPGRVGMVSGLFFGFIFGISGIAAALLGAAADRTGLTFVFLICSFLPALGILTALLPNLQDASGDPNRR